VDVDTKDDAMIFAALNIDYAGAHDAELLLFTRKKSYVANLPPQFISSATVWMDTKIQRLTKFTIT
jgi:hypothetical protein